LGKHAHNISLHINNITIPLKKVSYFKEKIKYSYIYIESLENDQEKRNENIKIYVYVYKCVFSEELTVIRIFFGAMMVHLINVPLYAKGMRKSVRERGHEKGGGSGSVSMRNCNKNKLF